MGAAAIKGIAFPFRFGTAGHIVRAQGAEKLVGNMKGLALAAKNERDMEPDFGTVGHTRLHRGVTSSATRIVETLVREALERYEPRVLVRQVQVAVEERHVGRVLAVTVWYRIRGTLQDGQFSFSLRVGGDV